MFRVQFPTLAGTICALSLSVALMLPAASANAGPYKQKMSGSGHVSHAGSAESFSGERTYRRTGKRHKYSAHRRHGKRIAGHRHRVKAGRGHGRHRGHYGRRGRFGDIAIVIGATAAGGSPTNGASSVVLENGRCAAGEYCTLRLGPFSNSPKIITLNSSGRTITEGLLD